MSAHGTSSAGHNASQGGLDNIRKLIRVGIQALTAAGVIFVFFFVWQPWVWLFTPSNHSGTYQQQTAAINRCPGGAHSLAELQLSEQWTSINPNGCRLIYDIPSGVVELSDGTDTAYASGWFEFLPTMARVISGPVKGYYAFCPTSTGTTPINWDCIPM